MRRFRILRGIETSGDRGGAGDSTSSHRRRHVPGPGSGQFNERMNGTEHRNRDQRDGHLPRAVAKTHALRILDTAYLFLPPAMIAFIFSKWLHRLHPSKTEVRIYDYVDRQVPMPMPLRMFEKRLPT